MILCVNKFSWTRRKYFSPLRQKSEHPGKLVTQPPLCFAIVRNVSVPPLPGGVPPLPARPPPSALWQSLAALLSSLPGESALKFKPGDRRRDSPTFGPGLPSPSIDPRGSPRGTDRSGPPPGPPRLLFRFGIIVLRCLWPRYFEVSFVDVSPRDSPPNVLFFEFVFLGGAAFPWLLLTACTEFLSLYMFLVV